MFCLFFLSFLHLCTTPTNASNFGSLTVSHLILHFSSLDPFSLSKHSCGPHWAKIRNMEGKQREGLVWKIPRGFTYIHRASRMLWRLPGPEASASLGLLMWLVANDCRKGELPSWTQQVGSGPATPQCVCCSVILCEKYQLLTSSRSEISLAKHKLKVLVLLPQKGSP